jgi:FimV-like protein
MARKKAEARREEAPVSPLARARVALERGDVRRARQLLAEVAEAGLAGEREEARRLLERTGPDPRALMTVVLVLLLILFAAWAAILRGGSGG